MKRRLSSQLICLTADEIIKNAVIEIDDSGIISSIAGLQTETARTLFYNGVISNSVISLKERGISADSSAYNHVIIKDVIDLNAIVAGVTILDFGTENINELNQIFREKINAFTPFNLLEIIGACCYTPAKTAGINHSLEVSNHVQPVLWVGFDLSARRIREPLRIQQL